jgi:ppGpp synthetase/RelA/SpoT-type nucleotidyltranferase
MPRRERLKQKPTAKSTTVGDEKLDLKNFVKFQTHPLVLPLLKDYLRDATLAKAAVAVLVSDLESLNDEYRDQFGRIAFTTIEGRVKSEESFFRKLYLKSREDSKTVGITAETLQKLYKTIKDLAGVRFSCPYYDEVRQSITNFVRPRLSDLGHATDLGENYADKDYLDNGDDRGYRSYHFFVKASTPTDIFGNRELCLCEVQSRTELQHVWAVKSHDLLYKPDSGWFFSDAHVTEDMKQLSNSLRAADQALISIRDRVIKAKK